MKSEHNTSLSGSSHATKANISCNFKSLFLCGAHQISPVGGWRSRPQYRSGSFSTAQRSSRNDLLIVSFRL